MLFSDFFLRASTPPTIKGFGKFSTLPSPSRKRLPLFNVGCTLYSLPSNHTILDPHEQSSNHKLAKRIPATPKPFPPEEPSKLPLWGFQTLSPPDKYLADRSNSSCLFLFDSRQNLLRKGYAGRFHQALHSSFGSNPVTSSSRESGAFSRDCHMSPPPSPVSTMFTDQIQNSTF